MKLLMLVLGCLVSRYAFAALDPSAIDNFDFMPVADNIAKLSQAINGKLASGVIQTVLAGAAIQLALTFRAELYSGRDDIRSMLGKFVMCLAWAGFALWLLKPNQQAMLASWFKGYLTFAGAISGQSALDGWGIVCQGLAIVTSLSKKYIALIGQVSLFDLGKVWFSHLSLCAAVAWVFLCHLAVAFSVFMATMEFWLMFAVFPMMFALIPLSAFRDQGLAPVKSIMSLGLRITMLGVIVGINEDVVNQFGVVLDKANMDNYFGSVWLMCTCSMLTAILSLRAGAIASNLANGSSSLSGSDLLSPLAQVAGMMASAGGMAAAMGAAKAGSGAMSGAKSLANYASNGSGGGSSGGMSGFSGGDDFQSSPTPSASSYKSEWPPRNPDSITSERLSSSNSSSSTGGGEAKPQQRLAPDLTSKSQSSSGTPTISQAALGNLKETINGTSSVLGGDSAPPTTTQIHLKDE